MKNSIIIYTNDKINHELVFDMSVEDKIKEIKDNLSNEWDIIKDETEYLKIAHKRAKNLDITYEAS